MNQKILLLGGGEADQKRRQDFSNIKIAGNHIGVDIKGNWDTKKFWENIVKEGPLDIFMIDNGSESWLRGPVETFLLNYLKKIIKSNGIFITTTDINNFRKIFGTNIDISKTNFKPSRVYMTGDIDTTSFPVVVFKKKGKLKIFNTKTIKIPIGDTMYFKLDEKYKLYTSIDDVLKIEIEKIKTKQQLNI